MAYMAKFQIVYYIHPQHLPSVLDIILREDMLERKFLGKRKVPER